MQALRRGAAKPQQQSLFSNGTDVAVRERQPRQPATTEPCDNILIVEPLTQQHRDMEAGVRVVDLHEIIAVPFQATKQNIPPLEVRAPHAAKVTREVTRL